jgi:hypothetical protein
VTDSAKSPWRKIEHGIRRELNATEVSPFLFYLFYLHFLFIVMQLHSFPVINFIGQIRLPGILAVTLCVLFLPYIAKVKNQRVIQLFFVILAVEGFRGVVGYHIFPSWVLNDKWQFEIWQLLLVYFFSLVIPLTTIFSNGKGLRILIHTFVYMGAVLGLWSLTHAGFGPGGYLGDENDNCLLLVSLLPFPFFLFKFKPGVLNKLICLISGILLLFGIIVTNSRGGYLGLGAVLGMFFLTSRNKGLWVTSALVIGLASLPFVPDEFWGEVKSIGTDSRKSTGTIHERLVTWGIITRMWMDPSNTLFGVGLENSKFNIGSYEGAGAGVYIKSLHGRATHSFYFQVLGDLGVYGVIIFSWLIFTSLLLLRKVFKLSIDLEKRLESAIYKQGNTKNKQRLQNDSIVHTSYLLLIRVHKEIVFLRDLSLVVFSSWFGLLVSALGISVAYYPPFWLFCALSVSIYLYFARIRSLVEQTEKMLES